MLVVWQASVSTSCSCATACSCWVLGRYCKWLLERADSGQRGELDSVMAGLCERCLDHNRRVQVGVLLVPSRWDCQRGVDGAQADGELPSCALLLRAGVQEAACGALATFLEEGEPERQMAPYIAALLQTLAAALQVVLHGLRCTGCTQQRCDGHVMAIPGFAEIWSQGYAQCLRRHHHCCRSCSRPSQPAGVSAGTARAATLT